ncbi:hypothetical protein QR680_003543 [Steinernema hermaphroditum]|uniref:Uncharacterized protein n=1 Tax=Steinernema hermaphroditum TaxID=289476 RepID=A0AA39HN00_9BILA|nr:hypothetical protein QR680_003543 [Steinernema hermaphroditum]
MCFPFTRKSERQHKKKKTKKGDDGANKNDLVKIAELRALGRSSLSPSIYKLSTAISALTHMSGIDSEDSLASPSTRSEDEVFPLRMFPSVRKLVEHYESKQNETLAWQSMYGNTSALSISAFRCAPKAHRGPELEPKKSKNTSYDREMNPRPLQKDEEKRKRWDNWRHMDFDQTLNSLRKYHDG